MRIWDLSPEKLCRQHLLGEHRELHGLWNILIENKTGYRQHPETKRWDGKLKALFNRHDLLIEEMKKRGYKHNTPLDRTKATGSVHQEVFIDTIAKQEHILSKKDCSCLLSFLK